MRCVQGLNNQRLLVQLKLSGRYPSLQRTIRTGLPSEVKLIPQTTSLNQEETELVNKIKNVLSHTAVHREITGDILDIGMIRVGDKFGVNVYPDNEPRLEITMPKPDTILLISFVTEGKAILELMGEKFVIRCMPGRKKSLLHDFTVNRSGKIFSLVQFLRNQGLQFDPVKVFSLTENGGIIKVKGIEDYRVEKPSLKRIIILEKNGKRMASSLELKHIEEMNWRYHVHPDLSTNASYADLQRSFMAALMTKVLPITDEPIISPEIIFNRIGRGTVYIPNIGNITEEIKEMRETFKSWKDFDEKTLVEFGEKLEREFFIKIKISGFELR